MSDTPNLDLPLLSEAQESPDIPINEGRYIVDALLQARALERERESLPAAVEGDMYLLASTGLTGDAVGHEGEIAAYQGGGWRFYVPKEGWRVFVIYDGGVYQFDGGSPGEWVPASDAVEPSTVIEIQLALSDLVTDLTSGVGKAYVRAPCDFTITDVRASLFSASSAGGPVAVDINVAGATILSTKLTIDDTEKTSLTASVPAVVSDPDVSDDQEITFDIDDGGTDALGLIVTIIGTRS